MDFEFLIEKVDFFILLCKKMRFSSCRTAYFLQISQKKLYFTQFHAVSMVELTFSIKVLGIWWGKLYEVTQTLEKIVMDNRSLEKQQKQAFSGFQGFRVRNPLWTIWDHLGPKIVTWDRFGPFGTILDHFGPFWKMLDLLGPFWPFLT